MANFNFNKVIIGGRLTQEPELKTTQSGISVVSFSIAVNRKAKQGEEQKADFFNVTAWRQVAEPYLKVFPQRLFHLYSRLSSESSWQDQNGQKHSRTDIIADEVMFVDSKSERTTLVPTNTNAPMPNFEEIKTDDDLPF